MSLGPLGKGGLKHARAREDEGGRFVRPETSFRSRVTADGSSGLPAEADRYHLYVSWACPWAHRTAIMCELKGLEASVSLSSVDPIMGQDGWAFSSEFPDPLHRARLLREVYAEADPGYTGRVTVPVLWDKQTGTIVNNESREIVRMLDKEFGAIAPNDVDLCPEDLREEVDRTITAIYEPVNNGVYKAGFATTQRAYEEAVTELFDALDRWEGVLSDRRYLCGDVVTEADVCLFPTLVRFDAVYHGHFKCNLRRVVDYPNLWGYLKDIYAQPGVAGTVDLDHTKRHYYGSHRGLNPTGVVPKGPMLNLDEPHGRERLTRVPARPKQPRGGHRTIPIEYRDSETEELLGHGSAVAVPEIGRKVTIEGSGNYQVLYRQRCSPTACLVYVRRDASKEVPTNHGHDRIWVRAFDGEGEAAGMETEVYARDEMRGG